MTEQELINEETQKETGVANEFQFKDDEKEIEDESHDVPRKDDDPNAEDGNLITLVKTSYCFTAELEFDEIRNIFVNQNILAFEYKRTRYYGAPPERNDGEQSIEARKATNNGSYQECFSYEHTSEDQSSVLVFWVDISVVETISPTVWAHLRSEG
jgi:hypothetical protein